jgi:hypothetical protein
VKREREKERDRRADDAKRGLRLDIEAVIQRKAGHTLQNVYRGAVAPLPRGTLSSYE